MYGMLSAVKQAIKAPAREVSGGVYIFTDTGSSVSSYLKPNEKLIDFTIEKSAPMGKFFGFTVSQKITVKVIGSYPLEKGRKIQPYFTVAGQTTTYTPFFYVEEVVIDEVANTTTITAYDIFQKAQNMAIGDVNITLPTTLLEYTRAVVAALGASLVGSAGYFNPTLNVVNINGTESLRDILTAVAEATGTICYIYQGDYIKFRYLENVTVADTIDASQYFEFSTQDSITLTQIASTTQLGENVSYGEAGFTQAIWDNPFLELHEGLEEHLETLGTEMIGKVMTPYNFSWRGNPYHEIGDYIEVKTAKSNESKYIYYLNEVFTYKGGYKAVANWNSSENENIDTTPTTLTKVLKQTYSKVDKVNNEITLVAATANQASNTANQAVSQVGAATDAANEAKSAADAATAKARENTEAISSLRMTTENISLSVEQNKLDTNAALEEVRTEITTTSQENKEYADSAVEDFKGEVTQEISSLKLTTDAISSSVQEVKNNTNDAIDGVHSEMAVLTQRVESTMTSEMVQVQIKEAMSDGVSSVTTTTGFTFNDAGLSVSKSDSEMTTQITEDGMTVKRNEEPMLIANNQGVNAVNLHASTYLTIGLNSRFEDYDNRRRTGCFWMGG